MSIEKVKKILKNKIFTQGTVIIDFCVQLTTKAKSNCSSSWENLVVTAGFSTK
jgi:hypothetical protein